MESQGQDLDRQNLIQKDPIEMEGGGLLYDINALNISFKTRLQVVKDQLSKGKGLRMGKEELTE